MSHLVNLLFNKFTKQDTSDMVYGMTIFQPKF
jgi:hypothetical protein